MNKKRKMGRAERRLLKRTGFGREFKGMRALPRLMPVMCRVSY